jgi:hypothetical protein
MRNFLESRYLLLTWCLSLIRSLGAVGVILLVAFALWATNAGAEQVSGPQVDCPPGMVLVQMSLGARVIYAGCWSTAELERAGYKTLARTEEGQVTCRTLIVKGK